MNGFVDFNCIWLIYKEGFGEVDGDYWFGKNINGVLLIFNFIM